MNAKQITEAVYNSIKNKKMGKYLKKDFAADMGISPQDLSRLFVGKVNIGRAYAEKLAHALIVHDIEVTPGHILDGLSQENWELIPKEKETPEKSEATYVGTVDMSPVPLLTSIPAGDWKEWIDDYPVGYGEDTVPRYGVKGEHVFAIEVSGDSMVEDGLHPGDLLYVDPEKEFLPTRTGRIGVVKFNGGYKIRRVKLAGDGKNYLLEPSNPAYEPEMVPMEQTTIFKVVRWMPNQDGMF